MKSRLWGLISPYQCWVSSREVSGECGSEMWVQFGPETNVVLLLNVTRLLSQRPAGNREVLRPRRAASQATQTIPHYTTLHSSTRSLLHLLFSCTLLGLEVMLFAWAARLILSILLSDCSSRPRNNVEKWEQAGFKGHCMARIWGTTVEQQETWAELDLIWPGFGGGRCGIGQGKREKAERLDNMKWSG